MPSYGRFELGLGYTAEPGSEEVSFGLKDVDSAWKIEDLNPTINPHASKPRAIAWLKTALAAEKDAVNEIARKSVTDSGRKPVVGSRFTVSVIGFSVSQCVSL